MVEEVDFGVLLTSSMANRGKRNGVERIEKLHLPCRLLFTPRATLCQLHHHFMCSCPYPCDPEFTAPSLSHLRPRDTEQTMLALLYDLALRRQQKN